MAQRHLAKLIPDASFDCISVEFNCAQLPTRHYLVKCTERGSCLPFLEKTSSSWLSSCPGAPSPVANPSSPRELPPGARRVRARGARQGGHSRSSPVSSGCQGAASLPFIPELPQESRGLPRVRASIILLNFKGCVCILCVCVCRGGCARSPGSFARFLFIPLSVKSKYQQ